MTFEIYQSSHIADLLEQRGVTVDRTVGHLGWRQSAANAVWMARPR